MIGDDFSKKLNYLIQLSSCSNSTIAHKLCIDPSYISKLRHGSRTLPRDSEHAPKICTFIVSQCKTSFQRQSLCDTIKLPSEASDGELERRLLSWLYEDDSSGSVRALLNDFSTAFPMPPKGNVGPKRDMVAFYGDEGRRQASVSLFNLALSQPEPSTLLFYSDEDATWMGTKTPFFYEWSSLLWQLILKGSKIKVIHKVSNDIDEMFDTIRRWLPLYSSGAVEAYYYPRLRDGIYKRSLSVVQGIAATFSMSIGAANEASPTFLVQDSKSVDSFTDEFYSYAALCRPLVEFYKIAENKFLSVFRDFLEQGHESIVRSDSLTLTTVPKKVIRNLEERIKPENIAKLRRIHESWNTALLGNAGTKPIYHILRLASPNDVLAGAVPISCLGLLEGQNIYYKPDEYCAHLEYLIWLLDNFPWFNICLSEEASCGYTFHVFEDQEVYIFKEVSPYIISRIRENNMVRAFWEYTHRIQNNTLSNREAGVEKIRSCLNEIRKKM